MCNQRWVVGLNLIEQTIPKHDPTLRPTPAHAPMPSMCCSCGVTAAHQYVTYVTKHLCRHGRGHAHACSPRQTPQPMASSFIRHLHPPRHVGLMYSRSCIGHANPEHPGLARAARRMHVMHSRSSREFRTHVLTAWRTQRWREGAGKRARRRRITR